MVWGVIEKVAPVIMMITTLVWAISVIVDTLPNLDYEPPATVHLVMAGVVAIIGAVYGVRRNDGKG